MTSEDVKREPCYNIYGSVFLAGSYQLASAALVNNQLNASTTHVLPQKGACRYQWPLMSEVKVSSICDRRGWEPSGKAKLPDVFCHLFRLPEQAFVLVHLLRGLGVSDCICCGCSPSASSSSWHLKLAGLAMVYTWNVQATQPCESKLSVSQCRTLKRWPACWTELHCTPLLHLVYMIYMIYMSIWYTVYMSFILSLCIWSRSFISPHNFLGGEKEEGDLARVHTAVFDLIFSLVLPCLHYHKESVNPYYRKLYLFVNNDRLFLFYLSRFRGIYHCDLDKLGFFS